MYWLTRRRAQLELCRKKLKTQTFFYIELLHLVVNKISKELSIKDVCFLFLDSPFPFVCVFLYKYIELCMDWTV